MGSTYSDNTGEIVSGVGLYAEEYATLSSTGDTMTGNGASSWSAGDVHGGAILLLANNTLTITGGEFTENYARDGGFLYVDGESVVTVTGASFSGNLAHDAGAAIYASGTTLTMEEASFTSNRARGDGGAVYIYSGTLYVSDCQFGENRTTYIGEGAAISGSITRTYVYDSTFIDNRASWSGGAIHVQTSRTVEIARNTFAGNLAYQHGGAISVSSGYHANIANNLICGGYAYYSGGGVYLYQARDAASGFVLTNNLFVENESTNDGGALSVEGNAATLTNNTFVGNTADGNGGTIYGEEVFDDVAAIEATNNLFAWTEDGYGAYANEASADSSSSFRYNGWYENAPAHTGGEFSFSTTEDGNIEADPGFVDYTMDGDCFNDDLSLADGSSAADAGDPDLSDTDGTTSDMGAYGGPGAGPIGTEVTSPDGEDCGTSEERCDGRDNDCDGAIDESEATDALTWYADADGDGYGDPDETKTACNAPDGYTSDGSDCDDSDATVNPGAAEIPDDGVDQDCSGADEVSDVDSGETGGGETADSSTRDTAHTGSRDDTGDSKDPTPSEDTGHAKESEKSTPGCGGCASGGAAGSLPGLLLLLLLGSRRRSAP